MNAYELLAPREVTTLRNRANGLTNDETAGRMGISPFTVKSHITRIFVKLDVASIEAAYIAVGWLIVPTEAEDRPKQNAVVAAAIRMPSLRAELIALALEAQRLTAALA